MNASAINAGPARTAKFTINAATSIAITTVLATRTLANASVINATAVSTAMN